MAVNRNTGSRAAVVTGMMRKETDVIDGISSRTVPPPAAASGDTPAPALRAAPTPATPTPAARAAIAGGTVAPPIDADRVAALRAAIASGSYRVDPIAIAQRIIAADAPPRAATNSG